jgi:3-keto-disaccharide hydrolase
MQNMTSARRALRFWLVIAGIGSAAFLTNAQQQQQPPQTPPAGQTPAPAGRAQGPREEQVKGPNGEVWGASNTAFNEGSRWRIHDADRPQPRVVTPGSAPGAPPSDAIVLFGGKDLSQWVHRGRGGEVTPASWNVHDGIFESGRGTSISTKDNFGDVQLHIEFATPSKVEGTSQGRGNSGVIFMGRYEIQVLDSFNNRTYADGMAASIYGDTPPLVNAARKPGEWQTYDIVFEAPKFSGKPSPAYFTVFWNGVMVHNRREVQGPTSPTMATHTYTQHDPELPLSIQNHGNPVSFRNVWIRRLTKYDDGAEPQK